MARSNFTAIDKISTMAFIVLQSHHRRGVQLNAPTMKINDAIAEQ
jgi:hypothetical protein